MQNRATIHDRWPLLAAILWLGVCASGLGLLWLHAGAPAALGSPAAIESEHSSLTLDGKLPTLVMYAHPKCPCTRASVAQVARVQARFPDAFAIRFAMYEPGGADGTWRDTPLVRAASDIPGAEIIPDIDGRLAIEAGAEASGLVALYSPRGEALFWGGITPSRGHEGPCDGLDALDAVFRGESPVTARAPVYGCAIVSRVKEGAP